MEGAELTFDLSPSTPDLPPDLLEKHPYLSGCSCLKLPPDAQRDIRALLTGQLLVSMASPDGKPEDATGLQVGV